MGDSEKINEKNEICMESVREYVFKQLEQEIVKNNAMQVVIDEYKAKQEKAIVDGDEITKLKQRIEEMKQSKNGNDAPSTVQNDALAKQTKKNEKLNMKLQ